jgi:hypothetical protein
MPKSEKNKHRTNSAASTFVTYLGNLFFLHDIFLSANLELVILEAIFEQRNHELWAAS